MNPIHPAILQHNEAGIPYSASFDDIYHSPDGGLGQAESVFMAGNGLPQRWQQCNSFTIVETGFGQGLNFLATWQAWRDDPARCGKLHFVSVEQFPFTLADLQLMHARYPQLAALTVQLHAAWPLLTAGFHRLVFEAGNVVLTLMLGSADQMLPELDARADAIYLDGFSPAKNPGLWSPLVFRQLWRLSHADTTLATYSVAGSVRRGLTEAGFAVEKAKGFASKWAMLRGRIARVPRQQPGYSGARQAIVIGAGIAGCAAAERLAARGWQITVLEAAAAPATGASGNHVGLMHAYCSLDDNQLARLSRAGSAATLQSLAALRASGRDVGYAVDGILQVAKNAEQASLMARLVHDGNWPAALVRYLDSAATSTLLGQTPAHGGWWFEQGAWINPASACNAWLQAGGPRIRVHYGAAVQQLARDASGAWQALDAQGHILATAPVVILANATAARQIAQATELPVWDSLRVASKVADTAALPRQSLAGLGYLTAAYKGERIIGASPYDDDLDKATAHNLAALQKVLPAAAQIPQPVSRVCKRPSTPDRLPLVGAIPEHWHVDLPACHQPWQLPRQAGLYAALGYGARGLTWAVLAGELLACELNGEPLPVERKLANALDPGRFLLRALRRGQRYSPDDDRRAEDDGD
ncbi:tRNA 5-methylaminomethyl-2-thiouridine biosynthesis bifunctional protein MnmC [Andreprevotia sp. IGB-42]|uniref:bifunctional tRNA (5-methylaminomethyl-2-thiouridine)(34)-methyltransferase MnmD/FAD-dependent 5-carboxymethylaminomethyl-2-thiouridine(34) oxidoreductase MnmC n=1 Tax=Andreprevotia sp. IGB-42 TaxID=2497473 RepID=UPI0013574286|nr:bifunctional tRNA (5-methylaminomethyl-2-thiouridine)(34)-methyltransferase MnmD/FAD-dependent 5-carboxymethylaminomethyl-2-thiouridine(34) oxidoreductase MnmC [Andreprevotia sp. IGB-42]KAF0813288.1 tRNA 5-methylaminomethyl-2-thiouridine biosynthesis bifunctional protein MnmC [Andreprevotia sp. IGB-42]